METILKKIQDTVIKYADVLSEILKVDVEIVDDKLIRIAGTGKYKDKVNESLEEEGYVYKKVLLKGEKQVIKEPGKETICGECPNRDICIEKFEMCTPIKLKEKVIGVIGLICFHENQKKYLVSNFDIYSTFLEQIADFISAKAFETIENQRTMGMVNLLKTITDEIEEAVITLDGDYCISHANKKAISILNISDEIIVKVNYEFTGNCILDQQEYKLELNNKKYFVVGYVNDIKLDEKYKYMFVFSESQKIKDRISKLSNIDDDIIFNNILGSSSKIMNVKNNILKIAKSTSTVLITGESGSGKEMFSRAIHKASSRSEETFIPINCGAIPENLLESELFGYVKGAFTGADSKGKIGKFEIADKGTVFLDEIGDMPLYMQVKLLRVLQEKELTRIGSNKSIKIDVRIIAATNRDLEEMINEGSFREDLYYRLNVIPIEIPPLRQRIEDIKVITYYNANKYSKLFNKKFIGIDSLVWDYFSSYDWPGNIRELQNTVEFMINMMDSNGVLIKENIPQRITMTNHKQIENQHNDILNLKNIEKETIKKALDIYGVNTEGKKEAAKKLGIGIATLYRKIEEYNLSK
jgi:transcriptional regulator with PAS, ATPase and Fis domain